jgi:hypothetical protein
MDLIFIFWNTIYDVWVHHAFRDRLRNINSMLEKGQDPFVVFDMFDNGEWKYKQVNDKLEVTIRELDTKCCELSKQIQVPDIRVYLEPAMLKLNARNNFRSFFNCVADLMRQDHPQSCAKLKKLVRDSMSHHTPDRVKIATPTQNEEFTYNVADTDTAHITKVEKKT